MRALLLFLYLITVPCWQGHADQEITTVQLLTASGVAISSYVLPAASNVTTKAIYQRDNNQVAALILNTTGTLNISQQTSDDGTNWFNPSTTNGSSLTVASTVVVNAASDSWIILTAKLARFTRFVLNGVVSGTISMKYIYQANDSR